MIYVSPSKIIPDCKEMDLSVPVYQYYYTKHNVNSLDMPSKRTLPLAGITIHNTDVLGTADDCKNYIAATINGNLNDVRVNYYVSPVSIYHGLEDDRINWSCGDGAKGLGNNTTIAIEIIMDNTTSSNNIKSMENGARLTAYLLHKYNMNIEDNLFTHTYWLNVMMGKKADKDTMCTVAPLKADGKTYHKTCPYYIIKGKGWKYFKALVKKYLDALNKPVTEMYRIRKTWADSKTQIGAFANLESAKDMANYNEGYKVFNSKGQVVYTPAQYYTKYSLSKTDKAYKDEIFGVITKGTKVDVLVGSERKENDGTIWIKALYNSKTIWLPLNSLQKK